MGKNTIAYVGSYTYIGESRGITIFDVDEEKGTFTRRKEVPVNNSSYLVISHSKQYLYSLADEGIVSYRILPDGDLAYLNTANIRGMRGRFIEISRDDRFLFVAGYHDGKLTIVRVGEDGSAGEICDSFYDKGTGSIAERSFQAHLSCVHLTPDNKFLCVANLGTDQIKIFRFDHETGQIKLTDILRCELDSGPRYFLFSKDGRFMYVTAELKNTITVYSYSVSNGHAEFERVQTVSTLGKKGSNVNSAAALRLSADDRYLFCSNAGDNSVAMFARDAGTGELTQCFVLPISGGYPKDIGLFDGDRRLYSVNFEESTLTFFHIQYEKNYITMYAAPLKVDQPNCCVLLKP
ncbi:MAG: lactonase family protein [Lachnospiraceae bacterium]|nr:lactonase family protein [Lachnospiraceae bacterium]